MNIVIIDAHGGGIGRQLIQEIRRSLPEVSITAVGTNSAATENMRKAGADHAVTGENAVVVCCRKADVIIGSIGIVIADSMLGEITPRMALAVAQSDARRILIPVNHCDNIVAGIQDWNLGRLIQDAVRQLRSLEGSCQ